MSAFPPKSGHVDAFKINVWFVPNSRHVWIGGGMGSLTPSSELAEGLPAAKISLTPGSCTGQPRVLTDALMARAALSSQRPMMRRGAGLNTTTRQGLQLLERTPGRRAALFS